MLTQEQQSSPGRKRSFGYDFWKSMDQLVNFIIRPPRAEYNPDCDLLDENFMLKEKCYQRKDIEVKNSRGDILQCSHYVPLHSPQGKPLPCVIYCHGNSGCRSDASEAAIILLPSNITVFTLDFSGSGLSGGEHVTLGWKEKDDLKAVVDYLQADGNVSLIGLWGRSMGAVASLMYGAEDPSIAGIVLDSPFSDLVDLMMELVDTYKVRLPKFIIFDGRDSIANLMLATKTRNGGVISKVKLAIQLMRKAIQKKEKFDIADLNTIKMAKSCFVPTLFGHAVDDDFIHPHHSDIIFEAYMGDKNIIKFDGDHNSPRPQFYFDSINIFFHSVLQPPEDEMGPTFNSSIHDYFGNGSWVIPEVSFIPVSSAASKEPVTSSTTGDIKQVHSKRPFSRTEVPSDIPSKENHPRCQDEGTVDNNGSSSSDMISFELSDGHLFCPHVLTTMDDDQYVEHRLDDLTVFPCNLQGEEKMFTKAITESLKDLEVRRPLTEEQPKACAGSSEPSQKDEMDSTDSSSTTGKCCFLSPDSTSTPLEHHQASLVINGPAPHVALEHASPDTSVSTVEPVCDAPSTMEPGSTGTSARSDAQASIQNSSDADDISDSTKATATAVRNPFNNIIDGLMRRWDLSFIQNT